MNFKFNSNDNKILNRIFLTSIVVISAFWLFSVAIHDIIDPSPNISFTAMVLKGGTPRSSLSITSSVITLGVFYAMVAFESIAALISLVAAFRMIGALRGNKFNSAKRLAVVGILLAFIKYFFAFVVIGAEWFYLWQTSEMTQVKSAIFGIYFLVVFILTTLIE